MSAVWAEVRLRDEFVAAAIVLLLLWWAARTWSKANGIAPKLAEDALFLGVATALVVGRLVWVGVEAPQLYRRPFDLIRLQAGIDYPSAAATFALIGWIEGKRWGAQLAEFFGTALLVAVGAYAGLCLFRGDCYGGVAAYPFAIRFPQFSSPRLPIGVYEFVAFSLALILLPRGGKPIAFLLWAVATFAMIEFAVEFGRVGSLSRFTFGWRWGWLLMAGSAAALGVATSSSWRRASANRPSSPHQE